jgi:hypothetical protein
MINTELQKARLLASIIDINRYFGLQRARIRNGMHANLSNNPCHYCIKIAGSEP